MHAISSKMSDPEVICFQLSGRLHRVALTITTFSCLEGVEMVRAATSIMALKGKGLNF